MMTRPKITASFIFLLFPILLLPSSAFSQEIKKAGFSPKDNKKIKRQGLFKNPLKLMDGFQSGVSKKLLKISDHLDSYFGGDRSYNESRKSSARFRLSAIIKKGGKLSFDNSVRLRFAVPKTREKLKLFIYGDPDSDLPGEDKREKEKKVEKGEKNYVNYAEVRRVQKNTRRFHLSSGLGMKLRFPAEYYAKVRARATLPFKEWIFRLTQSLFWYKSSGFREKTQIDFDRKLGERSLFRITSNATWHRDRDYFSLNHNFIFFQPLSSKSALTWQAGVHGKHEDGRTFAKHYSLSLNLRKNFYKDYLYFEIEPGTTYARDNNFHSSPYLMFKLEMFFGVDAQ